MGLNWLPIVTSLVKGKSPDLTGMDYIDNTNFRAWALQSSSTLLFLTKRQAEFPPSFWEHGAL